MLLRALDVDVDLHLGGIDPVGLEREVRRRWRLCLREQWAEGPARSRNQRARLDRDLDPPAREPVRLELSLVEQPAVSVSSGRRHEVTTVVDHDPRRLQMRLTHAITRSVIAASTGQLLMLHAAALCHPETGATVVCVAPGNTGKSTLCTRLGPGRGYLSDETVGIRRDGTVAAYPKPISTRRPDWLGIKDEVPPADLGLTAPTVLPWVAGVILLGRDPGHQGPPRLEQLPTLTALTALGPESSGFMSTERPLTWLAALLESTGGARRVAYASSAQLEPVVAQIIGRTTR
ncbi:hypothetical protein BH24ACT8_BH24ACT8_09590 [soil metagenome]